MEERVEEGQRGDETGEEIGKEKGGEKGERDQFICYKKVLFIPKRCYSYHNSLLSATLISIQLYRACMYLGSLIYRTPPRSPLLVVQ